MLKYNTIPKPQFIKRWYTWWRGVACMLRCPTWDIVFRMSVCTGHGQGLFCFLSYMWCVTVWLHSRCYTGSLAQLSGESPQFVVTGVLILWYIFTFPKANTPLHGLLSYVSPKKRRPASHSTREPASVCLQVCGSWQLSLTRQGRGHCLGDSGEYACGALRGLLPALLLFSWENALYVLWTYGNMTVRQSLCVPDVNRSHFVTFQEEKVARTIFLPGSSCCTVCPP